MKAAPVVTAAIALMALAAYALPSLSALFILDREAILRGEWWRIFTAQFVHFSRSHLAFDVIVFAVVGVQIERRTRGALPVLITVASIVISAALLILEPNLRFFGGLSGVATGMLFFLALQFTEKPRGVRMLGFIVIGGVLAKLMVECFANQPLFAQFETSAICPSPISHAAGMATAIVVWACSRLPARLRNTSHAPARCD